MNRNLVIWTVTFALKGGSNMIRTEVSERDYDLILIGSGMGALTVASLMAQLRNKRVLVLERHFKSGGYTQDFKRQTFSWDVGIHYIGDMNEGSQTRNVFDLITGGNVQWTKMPEPFEKVVYPGLTFEFSGDRKRFQADLIRLFPDEAKAIRRYFKDLHRAHLAMLGSDMQKCRSLPNRILGICWQLWSRFPTHLTTKEYLDRHFKNSQLKALLTSQWGDYGLPPGLSNFGTHATVTSSFLNGGYYPVGGGGEIAKSVKAIVEEQGGKFLLNREVTEILIENDRAIGVRARKVNASKEQQEEYFAPVIVSDVGAANTYFKLIPPDYPIPFRASLKQFIAKYPTTTNLTVYLGLSDDPRQLGFQGKNYLIYAGFDHDETYRQRSTWFNTGKPVQICLFFPSLKDPHAQGHTAEILTWSDYDPFTPWKNQPWLHRDEDYQALKEKITDALIGFVDEHYPGFAQLVAYKELSTPLTNEYFTRHFHGATYGLPSVPERWKRENWDWTRPTTPVAGLYLAGIDVSTPGILGALFSSVLTLSDLPDGIFLPEIYKTAAQRQQTHRSLSGSQHQLAGSP